MAKKDFFKDSLKLHAKYKGKIETASKVSVKNTDDLATVYSPGVAQPCLEIAKNKELAKTLTIKSNTIAVVTDGSAVLGLGNIGPLAAIPVMEGKALLFKQFANVDAFPICLDTQTPSEIIETIRRIAPVFGGINLEDIAAPKCFEIEKELQTLGIPVFHDDQHGTAIVILAGLINACKVTGKNMKDLKIVINGAGAAGVAILKLLKCVGYNKKVCTPVKEVILCDTKGAIHRGRTDLNVSKKELLLYSNPNHVRGDIKTVMRGADVFIGVSVGGLLTRDDIKSMASDPIVFAMANPIPEIMPAEALKGGAAVVGTGRSDLPNQVNNVLAFPGIFRGALDAGATMITPEMKMAAVHALANEVKKPNSNHILPPCLNKKVAKVVAAAVAKAWIER
ncbi:MAG: NADP-dependent malic enzyme [Chitinophagales bacterium]|nr:NADP-dependent malic enzyme [Chitinophagales bacterium]